MGYNEKLFTVCDLARAIGTLTLVLLLAWSTTGWAASPSLAPEVRAIPPNANVERLGFRIDRQTKANSQKRLRMRQLLLLWVLASQPAK